MINATFSPYRSAFDGPLLPKSQRRLSRLLDCYFQNVLRAEPAKRDGYCLAS